MGAVLGAVAGGQKDKTSTQTNSTNESFLRVGAATADETAARGIQLDSLKSLDARLQELESSPIMANLNKLLTELGQAPSASRIQEANQFTNAAFAPQEEALNQAFADQSITAAQRAAQMGRSSADPILAAKLAQEQIRQRATLDSQKTAFSANYAQNSAASNFQKQLTGLTGLSAQAIQNRQAVYGLGSDFANTLQQYRLATATQVGSGQSATNQYSGGGFKGAVAGFNAGSKSDASALAYFSDRNGKDHIKEASDKLKAMFLKLKPYEYEYKNKAHGKGKHIGVMAQDLQKSELGSSVVESADGGMLRVDMKKSLSLLMAAVADLYNKVEART